MHLKHLGQRTFFPEDEATDLDERREQMRLPLIVTSTCDDTSGGSLRCFSARLRRQYSSRQSRHGSGPLRGGCLRDSSSDPERVATSNLILISGSSLPSDSGSGSGSGSLSYQLCSWTTLMTAGDSGRDLDRESDCDRVLECMGDGEAGSDFRRGDGAFEEEDEDLGIWATCSRTMLAP